MNYCEINEIIKNLLGQLQYLKPQLELARGKEAWVMQEGQDSEIVEVASKEAFNKFLRIIGSAQKNAHRLFDIIPNPLIENILGNLWSLDQPLSAVCFMDNNTGQASLQEGYIEDYINCKKDALATLRQLSQELSEISPPLVIWQNIISEIRSIGSQSATHKYSKIEGPPGPYNKIREEIAGLLNYIESAQKICIQVSENATTALVKLHHRVSDTKDLVDRNPSKGETPIQKLKSIQDDLSQAFKKIEMEYRDLLEEFAVEFEVAHIKFVKSAEAEQSASQKPAETRQETNKDELRKVGVAKEFVSVVSEALKLISNADDLNSTLRSKQVQNLAARITVLGQDCGLLEEHHKVGLDAGSYYHQQYVYDTCLYPEEIGEFEWSVPNELRLLCEKAKLLVNKAPAETGQKSKPAEEPSKEAKNVFKKDGNFWQVAYQSNDTATIKDSKGMSYIARLLEKPNEPIAALSLASPKSDTKLMIQGKAVENDTVSSDSGKPQEIIDEDTLQSCQKRIIDIKNELADAEKKYDLAGTTRLQNEKDKILSYIKTSTRPSGQSGSFNNNVEKARKAVSNSINRAIDNIKQHNTTLYKHLDNSIQQGVQFAYNPDTKINWEL